MLEGGREEVARADGDADGQRALEGALGGVALDGEAGIDADAGEEVAAHGGAGPLGGDHDDIHALGSVDAGQLAVDPAEAVGEVEGLALGEVGFHAREDVLQGAVVHEHHDDGGLFAGLLDVEEADAGLEAVLLGAGPIALEAGILADDDLNAVVAHVERLGGALDAVADDGDDLVLEDLLGLLQGEFGTGDDVFLRSAKINLGHNSMLLLVPSGKQARNNRIPGGGRQAVCWGKTKWRGRRVRA